MKIAIPLAQAGWHHFATVNSSLVDVAENDGKAMQTTLVTPPPHEPGLLPRWLHTGRHAGDRCGMGQRHSNSRQSGIKVAVGRRQAPQTLVSAYLDAPCNAAEHL